MANLSRAQVREIIRKAPEGTSPEGIVAELRKRGHVLEGFSEPDSARFETKLAPADEANFQVWKQRNAPNDSGADYDLRGAFKAGLQPDQASGHWPDTYKKPNHPTFSDQSIYASAAPGRAGHWQGDQYIAPASRTGSEMTVMTPEKQMRALGARALSFLPPAGGFLGGLTGGTGGGAAGLPAGPIGALLGAAAGGTRGAAYGTGMGRALEKIGQRAIGYTPDETPLHAALDIGGHALLGGAEQGMGNVLGKGIGMVAPGLMERALRVKPLSPGPSSSPRALSRAASTMLRHELPVGTVNPAGRLGSEQALGKAKVSGKHLNRLLKEADAAGIQISADEIARPILELIDDIAKQPRSTADTKAVIKMLDEFMTEHPGPMTPSAVKILKRKAQEMALPIIKRRKVRPGISDPLQALSGRFDDAIATGAKRALENMKAPTVRPRLGMSPGRMGEVAEGAGSPAEQGALGAYRDDLARAGPPRDFGAEVARRERTTSRLLDLIGQGGALSRAEGATSRVNFSPFGPLRPLGAMTPNISLSRPVVSRMALGAQRAGRSQGVRQSPRVLDALLRQLLFSEPQTAQPDSGSYAEVLP